MKINISYEQLVGLITLFFGIFLTTLGFYLRIQVGQEFLYTSLALNFIGGLLIGVGVHRMFYE